MFVGQTARVDRTVCCSVKCWGRYTGMSVRQTARVVRQVCWLVKTAGVGRQVC